MSKGSEEDKVKQAYLLGQKDADLKRSDSESERPPKSRESRDLMQLPRPEDVPLGQEYTPSEVADWESVQGNELKYMLKRTAAAEKKRRDSTKTALKQARELSERHDIDQLLINNGILQSPLMSILCRRAWGIL